MSQIDFQALAASLLSQARIILPSWLPGGRLVGREYTCGDLTGRQGDSLKVNIESGKWMDFASGDKGGDLISLFAAINSISQGEAARSLSDSYNFPAVVGTPSRPP